MNQEFIEAIAFIQEEQKEEVNKFKPVVLSDLLATSYRAPEWLVERLIPGDGITVMGGPPAVFKTWTYLHIAVAVASGLPLFGEFPTTQGGVLIVDEDNGLRELQKRLKMMQTNNDLPIHLLSHSGFKLAKNNKDLLGFVQVNEIKLIIFDPFVRIHNGDENLATSMSEVYQQLMEFVKAGITVLCVHHTRKPGLNQSNPAYELRGSSDILASAFCHLALVRDREDKSRVTLMQTKLRCGEEILPIALRAVSDTDSFRLDYEGLATKKPQKEDLAKELMLELLAQSTIPLCMKDIREQAVNMGKSVSDTTFKNAAAELVEAGQVHTKAGPRNKLWYSLQAFEEVPSETEPPVKNDQSL